jgi:hypothetical protein
VVESSLSGSPHLTPRWWHSRVLVEGEEHEPGDNERVMTVPADTVLARDRAHPDAAAREASMRRHPAGRALHGMFTQTHPWLNAPAPEQATPRSVRDRVEQVAVRALERAVVVEARLAEMERRLAEAERRLAGEVEVRTFDGHVRTFDMPDASPTADQCSWVPAEPAE